jgi:hypothetical protein
LPASDRERAHAGDHRRTRSGSTMSKPTTTLRGHLIEAPTEGETKAGSRFVSARLREDSKIGRVWHLRAYSDHARADLAKQPAGAYLAVTGPFDAQIAEGETAPRIVWRLTATRRLLTAEVPETVA